MNQQVSEMLGGLRPNEFKLRQYEMSRVALTQEQRELANSFVKQGFSKKPIIRVFGCSYKDLKLNQ